VTVLGLRKDLKSGGSKESSEVGNKKRKSGLTWAKKNVRFRRPRGDREGRGRSCALFICPLVSQSSRLRRAFGIVEKKERLGRGGFHVIGRGRKKGNFKKDRKRKKERDATKELVSSNPRPGYPVL